MLEISARTVYIDPAVYQQSNCRARLERVLPYVKCADVREYTPAAADEFARLGARRHGKDAFGDEAVLVFTTFEGERRDWYYHQRDGAKDSRVHSGACQSAVELNIVSGCIFRCAYCGFGRGVKFSLDVERFIDGLEEVFARHPDQTLYKFSNMSDLPAFEPELDAVRPVIERFAGEDDRYLMLFTKSDNVDWLLPLDHRSRTIISWSLTCRSVSEIVDRRTAPLAARIAAMRKCAEAGYIVRARLSPVVPVGDWRREYAELVDMLFDALTPDIVTMELLGWMDFADLEEIIDVGLLDPGAVAAAREAAPALSGVGWRPFTEATHIDIHRFIAGEVRRRSPNTPIALCHGSPAMWSGLGGLTRMKGENYICNCGPTSAPGNLLYGAARDSSGG